MPQSMSQKKPSSLWEWQRYVKKETQRLMKGQETKTGRSEEKKPPAPQPKSFYQEELDVRQHSEPASKQRVITPERVEEMEEIEDYDKDLDVLMTESGVELDDTLEDWLDPMVEPIAPPKKEHAKQQARPQAVKSKPEAKSKPELKLKPELKTRPVLKDGKPDKSETLQLFGQEVERAKRKKNARKTREHLIENLLDPVITLDEAAVILNVCKTSVRRYTNAGKLECLRTPGNQRRFRLSTVLEFLEEKEGGRASGKKNE